VHLTGPGETAREWNFVQRPVYEGPVATLNCDRIDKLTDERGEVK